MFSDFATPALLGDSVSLEIPGIVHHEFEVVVPVNAHGHVIVVLDPFVNRNTTVLLVFLVIRVVCLESVQKLVQNLILGLLASLHIRVHLRVVPLTNVINFQHARPVAIHSLESHLGKIYAELVHASANSSQEFIVVNSARTISVKDAKELFRLFGSEANAEIMDCLLKLVHAEVSRAIIICDLELTSETHDTSASSCSQLFAEVVHNLSLSEIHGNFVDSGG